jgi:hypothetical protein
MTSCWEKAFEGWLSMCRSQLSALRAEYSVEVERFAESLRSRFEAGELRAFTTEDGEDGVTSPFFRLEELCCAHFRLAELQAIALALLVELSPRGRAAAGSADTEDVSRLQCAIAWDVIAVARARGWYEPSTTEERDPLTMKRCPACHHLDRAHRPACRVIDCGCESLGVTSRSAG